MMLINLLHTDQEIINLLNFGIEGTHFTLNGNVMTQTEKSGQYAPGVAWELGNQFLNYVWSSEAPDKWEQFKSSTKALNHRRHWASPLTASQSNPKSEH